MDTDTVKEDGKTTSIVLRVENRIVDLLRSREHRYTLEGQHTLKGATTDDGLEFMPAMVESQIEWGPN